MCEMAGEVVDEGGAASHDMSIQHLQSPSEKTYCFPFLFFLLLLDDKRAPCLRPILPNQVRLCGECSNEEASFRILPLDPRRRCHNVFDDLAAEEPGPLDSARRCFGPAVPGLRLPAQHPLAGVEQSAIRVCLHAGQHAWPARSRSSRRRSLGRDRPCGRRIRCGRYFHPRGTSRLDWLGENQCAECEGEAK